MLIILAGPRYAGKRTIARFLADEWGFSALQLATPATESVYDGAVTFSSVDEIESHVLSEDRWRSNWVVLGLHDASAMAALRKRPFVLVVAVDAPAMVKFARSGLPLTALPDMIAEQDRLTCGAHYASTIRADVAICNDAPTVADLHAMLRASNLLSSDRLRPGWDSYFMSLCDLAARRSNCMKRRVGCLLVNAQCRVLSTGYNGTPRGLVNCNHGGCARCNAATARAGDGLDACLCMHAEENALLEVGRAAAGATLYCTTFPCLGCAKKLVQCGVREVVFGHAYTAGGGDARVVAELFDRVGLVARQHSAVAGPTVLSWSTDPRDRRHEDPVHHYPHHHYTMSDDDQPRGRRSERSGPSDTDMSGDSSSASRSKSPLALRSLARLVARVVHTVLPPSLEAPLIKLRDDIAETTQALTSAYMRGDLLGAQSAALLAVKNAEEERLEAMLRDRESALDSTRRELESLRDAYMAEISKNASLAELYNSSHARRRKVIEELAMVKVTLDRVVDEKERLVQRLEAERAPPIPPLPETSTATPGSRRRSMSAKAVRFAEDLTVVDPPVLADELAETSSVDTELEDAPMTAAPTPTAY
ncbi:Deoxycytidine monophosphate (dCMP) deaminase [Blastocladiella emersonii ATCC 22665]|nr:Deoxycytidine monophosphate (dCMP) deaminase [Blastocladiella emersonii ATCC 22665]